MTFFYVAKLVNEKAANIVVGEKSLLSSRWDTVNRSPMRETADLIWASGRLTIKNLSGSGYLTMEEERNFMKLVWAPLSRHSSRPSMTTNWGDC